METLQPKLRFPEFKDNWKLKSLGDIGEFVGGGTPSTSNDDFWNGDINWFTPTEIKKDYVDNSLRKISELGLQKSSAKLLPIGTILLTTRATIGDVAIAISKCTTNQGFQSLVTNKFNYNYFIFNWFKKSKHLLIEKANGSTFPEISKSALEKITLFVPSLEEQTKIANFLSAVDERISLLKEKKTLLKDYKKGIMQKIFNQEIRFKDDNGNDFKEWEIKTLGEVGSVLNGLTYSPDDISEDGVLVLRSSNIKDNRLKFEDNVYVNKNNFTAVVENDILICVRNGSKNLIGKNTLITKEIEGVAFGAFMSVYRSNYNRYLIHWFGSNDFFENVNLNLGATINSINGSDLKKFKIPFPCTEEQTKIANFLSAIDEKIELVSNQIQDTQEYKRGLLQQMFA